MSEVIGVRFRDAGKIYYFSPNGFKLNKGQKVVVETSRGIECAEVNMENKQIKDSEIVKPLKEIIRVATDKDVRTVEENLEKEKMAFEVCQQKILKHNLDMKLTGVEYSFDGSKVLFYFTADGRVDFRDLVKDLAAHFRTRIELRQIGVRDEAKMIGGLGICGQSFCCSRFLNEFVPVSIKMAKEQNLSPNPAKISGSCGRLMCCLKYEHETYEQLAAETPCQGSVVDTPNGRGVVVDSNILTSKIKVRINSMSDSSPETYNSKDVRLISRGSHYNNRKHPQDVIAEYDAGSK